MATRSKNATVRLDALRRVALSEAQTDAQLLGKVRALRALIEAGDRSPVSRRRLLQELRGIAELEPLTVRGGDAFLQSLDLIDMLDSPPAARAATEREADPFLDLVAPALMADALGWRIDPSEWRRGSERTRRLYRDTQRVLGAADPQAAFEEWKVRQARRRRR